MIRQDYLLMMLAAGEGKFFQSSHIQKAMFRLGKIYLALEPELWYNFRAWDYGPFDEQIYKDLQDLAEDEMIFIQPVSPAGGKGYATTVAGWKKGTELLWSLPSHRRAYIFELAQYVLSMSFAQLVGVFRREYPEMFENSVFKTERAGVEIK